MKFTQILVLLHALLGWEEDKESIKQTRNPGIHSTPGLSLSLSLSVLFGSVTPYLTELNLIVFIGRTYLAHENILTPLDLDRGLVAVFSSW